MTKLLSLILTCGFASAQDSPKAFMHKSPKTFSLPSLEQEALRQRALMTEASSAGTPILSPIPRMPSPATLANPTRLYLEPRTPTTPRHTSALTRALIETPPSIATPSLPTPEPTPKQTPVLGANGIKKVPSARRFARWSSMQSMRRVDSRSSFISPDRSLSMQSMTDTQQQAANDDIFTMDDVN